MRTKTELKDLLADLDAVLHDNSWEIQQQQARVLDMVHQPQQWNPNVELILCHGQSLEYIDSILNDGFEEMAKAPQDDDARYIARREIPFEIGATPDYSQEWTEPPEQFYSPMLLDPQMEIVDGILYTCYAALRQMAWTKELLQWNDVSESTSGQAIILAQEPAMKLIEPFPPNPDRSFLENREKSASS